MKTLVLGLGNPILGDDGVGVRVAEMVQATLPHDAAVDVEEACVGGLGLMERMIGYDRVILVDALCRDGAAPGTVRRLCLEDLRSISPTQHNASAHDTNLVTALAAGRQMALALPKEITIFAIAVEHVLDFGDRLTPAVADAVPEAVQAVKTELGYQTIAP